MKKFPFYKQLDQSDCGPSCLAMISKYYGRDYSREYLREKCFITRDGVSALGISEGAEAIGMRSLGVHVTFAELCDEIPLPCIAHWRQNHFVVIHKIDKDEIHVADPAFGMLKYAKSEFLKHWQYGRNNPLEEGLVLLLETGPEFYEREGGRQSKRVGLAFLVPYFKPYTKVIGQLFLALSLLTVIQLIVPFLTQSLVDYGISFQNVHFVYVILAAQLMLFFSQTFIRVVIDWLLLHMGSRINISLLSDFFIKIMKLPVSFFDAKTIGDLIRRIEDHHRIEIFLSADTLNIIFSVFSLIVFGGVLAYFNLFIFIFYALGTALYIIWVLVFMRKRAELDYQTFSQVSASNSKLIELITGMREIKLNNSEKRRRWEFEAIQIGLHKISIKGLAISQYQRNGGVFISELKNIMITFFAATSVIEGRLTLGTMLAVQFIIGQLNNPIRNFISFMQALQDARLSLERIEEIHSTENEEPIQEEKLSELPPTKDIVIHNLAFQYGSASSSQVLKNLNFTIPEGKVTAIVGASGSGKTTFLKLMLKVYNPTSGYIQVGNVKLDHLNAKLWRQHCGVVMQDGFIFSDSIARNISESSTDGIIDKKRLLHAVQVANLETLIESLPAGYNTKINGTGMTLSGGQNQRVLIARAVYKNPDFLFFDEATSALDANNERTIMHNLEQFFEGKTVVIIAHRLSTVQKADKILVLEDGEVIEEGTHEELSRNRAAYYNLVKNQLELGQ